MIDRRFGAVLIGLAMAGSLAVVPAFLAPAAAASGVPCLAPAKAKPKVPLLRRAADHGRISAKDKAALEEAAASATSTRLRARTAAPRLAKTITIPVRVHVIRGTHRHERFFASRKRIRRSIRILNNAHIGKQSSASVRTRFRFRIKSIDRRTRDGWYHAYAMGPRTKRMMRALHRGGKRTLNLYISGPGTKAQPVLGFSGFPWQQHRKPRLDGVVVHRKSLTHGTFRKFNKGDTLVHEVGHWLGLFHTFEGGCKGRGDMVADTPAEARASFACPVGRDSCADRPGNDPVRNFMDYSYDACMRAFTAGQALRMDMAWAKWRQ